MDMYTQLQSGIVAIIVRVTKLSHQIKSRFLSQNLMRVVYLVIENLCHEKRSMMFVGGCVIDVTISFVAN